jgi:hypothetical protein
MVKHWQRELSHPMSPGERLRMRKSQAVNAVGAAVTGVVLVIVVRNKFLGGAYLAIAAMAVLFVLMRAVRAHYDRIAMELTPSPAGAVLPSRIHGIVPVSKLHEPTLRALAFARATRPHDLTAVTVAVDPEETAGLVDEWDARKIPVALVVLDSPYREITRPLLAYISRVRRESPRDVVCVYIPEYVVGHWWEQLLHNQSALRLKGRLLFQPGVMVTSVPWQLRSSTQAVETAERESRELAGRQ